MTPWGQPEDPNVTWKTEVTSWKTQVTLLEWLEDPGDTLGTTRRPQCHLEDHSDTPGVVGGPPVTSWRTQVTLLQWLEDPW